MDKQAPQHCGTKTALLRCAEKLFLAQGFSAVSIRQITKASGTNVASVNYHFTDKTGLFRAVLGNLLDKITDEKLALLKELEQRPGVTLEDVLDVYIRSFFNEHHSSPNSDRLMQIIYHEMGPDAVTGDLVATRLVVPINRAFKTAIIRTCPGLNDKNASFCVSSVTAQVLQFIRSREIYRSMREHEQGPAFIEDVIRHIKQFSLHGLRGYQNV